MPSKPETLSFEELIAEVPKDWRRAAQGSRTKTALAGTAYERLKREGWAVGYRLAELLYENDKEWERFQLEAIWKGRELDRSDVLRYGLQYEAGFASGPIAARCCAHANALLSAFYADKPISAADIPDYIEEEGGIEKLLKAFRKQKKSTATGASSVACEAGLENENIANSVAAARIADTDCDALEDDLDGLPEAVSASPPNVNVPYPAGVNGMFEVKVLVNAHDFDAIMRLAVRGPALMINLIRTDNGGSNFKRIEGQIASEVRHGH